MKYLVFFVWTLLSSCVITVPTVVRPEDTCSAIVTSALEMTDQYCSATSLNQACYGHSYLEAEPQPGFPSFNFDQAGDRIDVTGLQSLRVSAMDNATGDWGVALMEVQANLPGAVPGQDVTFLVFGDVEIENEVTGSVPVEVAVTARGNINIRQEPSLDGFVLGTLTSGDTVMARGRTADDSWLYVDLPDHSRAGWVYRGSMSSTADIETLRVVNPSTAHFGPMQAFYLQTGEDDRPSCSSVPNNGLMIQTSEGVAEVNLWINEVKIRLGSTAFITAQRNRQMTISMLEGTSHVEAMGVEYTAAAGSALTIPLDHNLAPAAPPNPPVPITDSDLQNLPVTILDRPITIPTIAPTATLTETPVPTIVTSSPTIEATSAFGPTSTSTLVTLTAEVTEEPSTATPEQTEAVDTPTLTFVPTETETPTETIELTAEMTAIPNAIETPIETIEPTVTPTHTVTPAPTATGV